MVRLLVIVGVLLSGAAVFAAEPPAQPKGDCKLVYSPMPAYPVLVRRAYFPVIAHGTFSVSFDASGKVREVKVIRSTRNDALDDAAISTLRKWKSTPGRVCSVMVPVNFHPGAGGGF